MQLYIISGHYIMRGCYTELDTLRLIQWMQYQSLFWPKKGVPSTFFEDKRFRHSEGVKIMSKWRLLRQDNAKVAKREEWITWLSMKLSSLIPIIFSLEVCNLIFFFKFKKLCRKLFWNEYKNINVLCKWNPITIQYISECGPEQNILI